MENPPGNHSLYHRNGTNKPCRPFPRKDQLTTHMAKDHRFERSVDEEGLKTLDALLLSCYKSPITDQEKRYCGFCEHVFDTRKQRMIHVAKHFKEGSTMKIWT
jgi:hypothetical protein